MSKKSSSSQSQSTNQTDARQVVDGGSIGNSGTGGAAGQNAIVGSGNSLVVTDHGLVEGALEYLQARDIAGAKQTDAILNVSGDLAKAAVEKAGPQTTMQTMIYAALGGLAVAVAMKGMK